MGWKTSKIGVYVCNCGTNIAKVVDCDAVVEHAATLPGVAVARPYKYMCSNPGQEMIVQDIEEHGLNRVVVAACSPRMHEPTFRKALQKARREPVLPRDGQHPRAVQLGPRRSDRGDREGEGAHPRGGAARRASTNRSSAVRSTCARTCS